MVAHGVIAVLTGMLLEQPFDPQAVKQLGLLFLGFVPVYLIFLALWRLGGHLLRVRPIRAVPRAFSADIREICGDPERLLQGMMLVAALTVFGSGVMAIKALIPQILLFPWDPIFAEVDRFLHGGVDPYRLILPLVGGVVPTAVINLAYHGWIVLMYFCLFVAAFSRADGPRGDGGAGRIYVMTHVLIWILGGNLMALVFSSAGPVYFERLGHGDTYAPLMAHLAQMKDLTPVWSLTVQDMVWTSYVEDRNIGISAMPSMHLTTSTLMALYAFRHSRWLGITLSVFVGIILVGSVYLGWHYAIDGYAGIVIAILCWRLAARLVAWSDRVWSGQGTLDAGVLGQPA